MPENAFVLLDEKMKGSTTGGAGKYYAVVKGSSNCLYSAQLLSEGNAVIMLHPMERHPLTLGKDPVLFTFKSLAEQRVTVMALSKDSNVMIRVRPQNGTKWEDVEPAVNSFELVMRTGAYDILLQQAEAG